MQHIQGKDRNQIQMISLEQMVAPQSMVRIIDAFCEMLDFEKFDFDYFKLNQEGRPPFHPRTMMKLYLYGYQNNTRSCRKLEKACQTNLEVMWLINELQPHNKTIANFRKDNSKAFKDVFRHFLLILKHWKLVEGETIAIDSFKVRAQNSLKNNYSDGKVKRHLKHIDRKIQEYEEALEEEFNQETEQKLNKAHEKKATLNRIQKQIEQNQGGQYSSTDPDARSVPFQRKAVNCGYNIQAASDAKNKLLIAADTGDVNDTKALAVMSKKAIDNLKIDPQEQNTKVLIDKGYHVGRELKATEQLGLTTFAYPKRSAHSTQNPAFSIQSFEYDQEHDSYKCPAGATLTTNGNWYKKTLKGQGMRSYEVKHYKTKSCKECKLRAECTKSKNGRVIERTEFAPYIDRNDERVKQNPDYYKQRQQIIEHQFGTIKRHWHFDYVLTRGKEKVLGEVYLIFTMYNLQRTLAIFGFDRLMEHIKALVWAIISRWKPGILSLIRYWPFLRKRSF